LRPVTTASVAKMADSRPVSLRLSERSRSTGSVSFAPRSSSA